MVSVLMLPKRERMPFLEDIFWADILLYIQQLQTFIFNFVSCLMYGADCENVISVFWGKF